MSNEKLIRLSDAISALTEVAVRFGMTDEPQIMILAKEALRAIPAVQPSPVLVDDLCSAMRDRLAQPSPDVAALVEAKLQAADAYANEITPNGGRRIDNITGLLSDRQAGHIATQINLAFKAGWQAAIARLKGGAA